MREKSARRCKEVLKSVKGEKCQKMKKFNKVAKSAWKCQNVVLMTKRDPQPKWDWEKEILWTDI